MSCKLAVLRKDSGRKLRGDCIEVFGINAYLGNSVEPVGGAYVVIEVNDCDKDHETIIQLTTDWTAINQTWLLGDLDSPQYISHQEYDRQYYLQPVSQGDEFFNELFTKGKINVPIAKVQEYIRERV